MNVDIVLPPYYLDEQVTTTLQENGIYKIRTPKHLPSNEYTKDAYQAER